MEKATKAASETKVASKNKMQAAFYKAYGDASTLQVDNWMIPTPGEDEILIKVMASSVNPVDCRFRAGEMKYLVPMKFPARTGLDFAGIVEWSNSKKFSSGDEVFGFLPTLRPGAAAGYIVTRAGVMAKKPANISFEEAAALPLAGLTVLQGLRDKVSIKAQEEVLIIGSGGGVGHLGVQYAVAMGAKVTAYCSPGKVELSKACGAYEVIDYTREEIGEERRFDIIFDTPNVLKYAEFKRFLADKGRWLSTEPDPHGFLRSATSIFTSTSHSVVMVRPVAEDLESLAKLVLEDKIKPHVSAVFSLNEIQQAHAQIDSRHTLGKVVIKMEH